jgi:hypothetical protein
MNAHLPSPAEQIEPGKRMKRSGHCNLRQEFVLRSAPFRFRTFHGFQKGRYDARGEQMFTLDRIVILRMPYLEFIARADATMADFDRGFV